MMFHGETPSNQRHISIGTFGEDIACRFLASSSFHVLQRNFRTKFGEIDIIAIAPDKTLVFVEVKTIRSAAGNQDSLAPEDNLSRAKIDKLKRICHMFANQHAELIKENLGWRIDLVAITLSAFADVNELTMDNKNVLISHHENIG